MKWLKRTLNKWFFKDEAEDDYDYYENDENEEEWQEFTEKAEQPRPKFRFPLIPDEEIYRPDHQPMNPSKPIHNNFNSNHETQHSKQSLVYDVEVSRIHELLEMRRQKKKFSSVYTDFAPRRKEPMPMREIKREPVRKEKGQPSEKENSQPPINRRRFIPSDVPSPVYGFQKRQPISISANKQEPMERGMNEGKGSFLEESKGTEQVPKVNVVEEIDKKIEKVKEEVEQLLHQSQDGVAITLEEEVKPPFGMEEERLIENCETVHILMENEENRETPIAHEPTEEAPAILTDEAHETLTNEIIKPFRELPFEDESASFEGPNVFKGSDSIVEARLEEPELEENEPDETAAVSDGGAAEQKEETHPVRAKDELNLADEESSPANQPDFELNGDEGQNPYLEGRVLKETSDSFHQSTDGEWMLEHKEQAQHATLSREACSDEKEMIVLPSKERLDELQPLEKPPKKEKPIPFNVIMLKSDKEKLAKRKNDQKDQPNETTNSERATNPAPLAGNATKDIDNSANLSAGAIDFENPVQSETMAENEANRFENNSQPVQMAESETTQLEQKIENKEKQLNFPNQKNENGTRHKEKGVIAENHYVKPPLSYLTPPEKKEEDREWMESQAERLVEALSHFQVSAQVESITQGPAVTQFEITVGHGTKVSKIRNLADDLKLALAAKDIRIQAPIPGKHTIGIEIPNRVSRAVRLSEVASSERFLQSESPLEAALGLDLTGTPVTIDLRKMPHGLIAGATGSGKSVCINSILTSLLLKAKPSELRLMLIDPKVVELAPYNHIPHLVSPVITDVKAATAALKWAVNEMERRYQLFAKAGVRDLPRYNQHVEQQGTLHLKLPYILIVIDELADLMMMAPQDVEESICRIAQKARACGIHLIIATQRPSVDVITGLIKSNIPTRIAFSVSSQIDSRTILDCAGAERLLGRGDMLYLGNGMSDPIRLQGTYVTDEEIERIIEHVKGQGEPHYFFEQEELLKKAEMNEEFDELFEDVCRFVYEQGVASTSLIQRKYHIGYNRAARLIEMLESYGFVSEQKGSKPREVYITESDLSELFD